MTFAERILDEMKALPEQEQQQVLDFAQFLKAKQRRTLEKMLGDIITENQVAFQKLAK